MIQYKLLLAAILFHFGNSIDPSLVSYYENLINTETNKAKVYSLDTNASRYRAQCNVKETVFGTYDFIVIGAGSSGSVIANRLSEISDWKILLIEAGGYENNFTQIPSMTTISTFSDYNWGFQSVPQKTVCLGMVNNICPYPRGRALGGTTVINGLAYSRGVAKGFDIWSSMGNPGWSSKDVLPYFLKSENFQHRDPEAVIDYDYHNVGGPLNVEFHLPGSRELTNFLNASVEIGYDVVDINGPVAGGVSRAPMNTLYGRRFSGYSAFLKPVEKRRNLRILTHSFVTKLIFNQAKTVTGVRFTHKCRSYVAKATKEVILSAGAISSPHLLLLSGVGPKKHLESKNITVVQDLEVGSAFFDHVGVGLFFSSNYSSDNRDLSEYINEYLVGIGGLAAPGPNDAFGFYQTPVEKTPNYPDLEIILVPNYGNATTDFSQRSLNLKQDTLSAYIPNNGKRIFKIDVFGLHSKSTGTIRLNSNDPFVYPLIDPNCLTDKNNIDIDTLYQGIQLVLKMMETTSMKEINTQLQIPLVPACSKFTPLSKNFWYCFIRQIGHPVNHPIGSCPMGTNSTQGAVVDNNLKVYGVKNLRVADASIFPLPLTGHPNAPCVMVGEKAADIIKTQYKKI